MSLDSHNKPETTFIFLVSSPEYAFLLCKIECKSSLWEPYTIGSLCVLITVFFSLIVNHLMHWQFRNLWVECPSSINEMSTTLNAKLCKPLLRWNFWPYVECCKYFNRHSTRLDVQPWETWGNGISFKAKTKYKLSKTYLRRYRQWIQQPGTHSGSAEREIRIAQNDTTPLASFLRMWVGSWFGILWVRTIISRRNLPKSTFRKPEQREQNYSSLLTAKLWARYS